MGRSNFITCEGREIHYTTWGDPAGEAVFMWHGLARNGRDFDVLAGILSERYFVVAPDTLGRGLSQWAVDPAEEYCYAFYGAMARGLVDRLGVDRLRWIGTSMGGVMGMVAATDMLKGRISHLVLNDIGPYVPPNAAARITSYVGDPPVFDTVTELERWLRTVYTPFGDNTEQFWRTMRDASYRRMDDGKITVHYDPKIVAQFSKHLGDLDRWDTFDAIDCPTMLIRGEDSDVLTPAVAAEMQTRGPQPRLYQYRGFGHAPTLCAQDQVDDILAFLAA